ncbi:MAG: BlaI/MecI/CopY family transcriptional regulator [Planctomycetaceae bacterium]|nr:BlaI/MecI/CopY family transcriptional regulator [Planctomycetaceae bacterium]
MGNKKKEPVKLTPGELELLEVFWNHGPQTIAQMHQALHTKGRKPAYSTVQTRLNRLFDKGIIARNGQYPAIYDALVAPEDVSGRYFDLLESLCGNNIAPLMLHLTEKRKFSQSELNVLRTIIEKNERNAE